MPYNVSSLSYLFIFSVITSECNIWMNYIIFLISKHNDSVKYLQHILSLVISKFVYYWVVNTSLSWWMMFLCESYRMVSWRYLYNIYEMYFTFLSINGWKLPWVHRHFVLSTRYDIFYDVGFLSLLSFSRGFIVNFLKFHHYSTIIFFHCFIFWHHFFNRSLKLIINKENTCLNSITNISSITKFYPKYA